MLTHRLHLVAGTAASTTSVNWAGYVQLGSKDHTFTEVTDTVVVPTAVTPTAGTQYESDWVGIGGFAFNPMDSADDANLVQAGVQLVTTTTNGKTSVAYDAWTEKLPEPEKRLRLEVAPGDIVALTVQQVSKNKWLTTVNNITTGRARSRTTRYRSTGLSAEAIEERPCLAVGTSCAAEPDDYAQLAETSNVTFDPGSFSETAPESPPVSQPLLDTVPDAALLDLTMVEESVPSTSIAVPSPSNTSNEGFTVADGSTPPPPPSP